MRQSITHRGRKSKPRPVRTEEKGSRRGQSTAAAVSFYWLTTSRYRNVTTCARVQVFSGQNSVALIPFVMPCWTAPDNRPRTLGTDYRCCCFVRRWPLDTSQIALSAFICPRVVVVDNRQLQICLERIIILMISPFYYCIKIKVISLETTDTVLHRHVTHPNKVQTMDKLLYAPDQFLPNYHHTHPDQCLDIPYFRPIHYHHK